MSYSYHVRTAILSDYPEVERLYYESDLYHHRGDPDYFCEPIRPSREKSYLQDIVFDENREIFLVLEKEDIVGFCEIYLQDHVGVRFTYQRRVAYVAAIYFEQDRRGVCSVPCLLEHITKWAKSYGAIEICGDMYAFNEPAIRMGFRRFNISRRYSQVFIPLQTREEGMSLVKIESRYTKKIRRILHRFRAKWLSSG